MPPAAAAEGEKAAAAVTAAEGAPVASAVAEVAAAAAAVTAAEGAPVASAVAEVAAAAAAAGRRRSLGAAMRAEGQMGAAPLLGLPAQ